MAASKKDSTAAPEHSGSKLITDQGFEGWPLGRVRQPPQSTQAPRPLLIRGSKAGPPEGFDSRPRACRVRDDSGYVRYMAEARAALPSRQGRSDRSHFALPLTDLTGKQRLSPRSDCCASHPGKADNSKFSLGRNRKLRLARPSASASGTTGSSASPDLRHRPREEVSASPDPKTRPQPRPRKESRPRPNLASASGEVSASPDLGLGPTAPQGIHHYPTPS
uniref:Putative growth-regulating factor 1 n=1 Tax=Zea mays TaxID=4577 RepID=Q6QP51_MAIZE|nr:putative growth-regulating factor 1 [Zea mays]